MSNVVVVPSDKLGLQATTGVWASKVMLVVIALTSVRIVPNLTSKVASCPGAPAAVPTTTVVECSVASKQMPPVELSRLQSESSTQARPSAAPPIHSRPVDPQVDW
ncbi:MAG: hypothetical protein ACHQ4J_03475 [Candidatus Binatia bacterium]